MRNNIDKEKFLIYLTDEIFFYMDKDSKGDRIAMSKADVIQDIVDKINSGEFDKKEEDLKSNWNPKVGEQEKYNNLLKKEQELLRDLENVREQMERLKPVEETRPIDYKSNKIGGRGILDTPKIT